MTINRFSRTATRIDIPKDFATYNHIQYFADRDHPSARENWFGFFPLREAKDIGCIMDRSIGRFQFDKLISAFMYDRLISKIW